MARDSGKSIEQQNDEVPETTGMRLFIELNRVARAMQNTVRLNPLPVTSSGRYSPGKAFMVPRSRAGSHDMILQIETRPRLRAAWPVEIRG